MAGQHRNWGEDRVFYYDDEGRLKSLPTSWTSLAAPDPFVTLAGGRSLFRYADLLALVKLLAEMGGRRSMASDPSGGEWMLRK